MIALVLARFCSVFADWSSRSIRSREAALGQVAGHRVGLGDLLVAALAAGDDQHRSLPRATRARKTRVASVQPAASSGGPPASSNPEPRTTTIGVARHAQAAVEEGVQHGDTTWNET